MRIVRQQRTAENGRERQRTARHSRAQGLLDTTAENHRRAFSTFKDLI
jgi:hypothetical protein